MELIIGKPVKPNKNPRNKYCLEVNAMSGDADAYQLNKKYFDENQVEHIKLAIGLCDWSTTEWPGRDSILRRINEIQKECGVNLYNLVGRDVTCYEHVCRPYFNSLTYFDGNGQEHNVKIVR